MEADRLERADYVKTKLPLYMVAGIAVISADRFVLDPKGTAANIVPVHNRFGLPEDLVAWLPDDPFRWWFREGTCPILGARFLAYHIDNGEPVPIHYTPADWVAAAGEGICVLDWDVNLEPILCGAARITTNHLEEEAALKLERLLKSNLWRGLPQIGKKRGRH